MEPRSGFCWTRYGPESGESFADILVRKEAERQANDGTFLWGIGNAVWPSLQDLLKSTNEPLLTFSPIRSKPKIEDVAPDKVVVWLSGRTPWGERYTLPEHSHVISRYTPNKSRLGHYALVCHSLGPLTLEENAELIYFQQCRNYLTGKKLGASQVTAVVYQDDAYPKIGPSYPKVLTVNLIPPYFIKLENPVVISRPITGEWNPSSTASLIRKGIGGLLPEIASLPLFQQ